MATQTQVAHPLDPLTAEEIGAAVAILRAARPLPERCRFIQVALQEPLKEHVLAFRQGDTIVREAFIILLDNTDGATYEAVVSLTAGEVRSWERIQGVQPPISLEEFAECEKVCKAHPAFREALARRGITDVDAAIVDLWSAGSYEDSGGRRLARGLVWVRLGPADNAYAHPIENLVTVVDLNAMEVLRVEDYGAVPVPRHPGNYGPQDVGELRPGLKPLEIQQPEGVSFAVDGYGVRWQKWRLRLGFTPREGLVLHTVAWEDRDRVRPILYRASLSEMVVPYGDPAPVHARKNAFDAGEYNIGALANSLELGCDCLGEVRYFDAVVADSCGAPMVVQNAICLHEEDYGLLWKHFDFRTGQTESRRSRRLVVSWMATVANYDYGFYWYFYQDGTIQFEGKLTGIVSTGAIPPGQRPGHGQLLTADGLYAPIHQHFFNFRLDLDVDGQDNTVYETHTEAATGDNPLRAAYHLRDTPLRRESEAQQVIDTLRGRHWRVTNPTVLNGLGEPVAYKLVPQGNILPFASDDANVLRRATFATKHLWVTPHEQRERHAAGDYPNQHPGGAGLPAWTERDRPIEQTDVVLWYTLGCQHAVRPEDWPVMPVEYVGFLLQPQGFFDRNPALDVTPPAHHAHNGV